MTELVTLDALPPEERQVILGRREWVMRLEGPEVPDDGPDVITLNGRRYIKESVESSAVELFHAVDWLFDLVSDFEMKGEQLTAVQLAKLRQCEEIFRKAGGKE